MDSRTIDQAESLSQIMSELDREMMLSLISKFLRKN